jgi:molybdopterin/thiamine biosynthesis adenylyltransferase
MDPTPGLLESIKASTFDRQEGCETFRCLSLDDTAGIGREHGLTTREVSIAALESGFLPLRYVKNVGTVGLGGQARLLTSRVLLVGAGGIGGTAAELLARMGVGTIVIVDPDVYDETNLNRQNFACADVIGKAKVDVASDRIMEINCDVEVIRRRMAADSESLPGLVEGADAVIDALDNLDDRLALQDACATSGVVMVHGAIAGTALQVTTIFPGDPGLSGFIPATPGEGKERGIEVETGNPATTPVICAVIQVQEAVKVILELGTTLRGKMLYLDMADWSFEFIDL